MATEYEFELWQDGMMVAEVAGDDLNSCRREIMHYAMMYAQDGPCQIRGASVEHLKPMIDALPGAKP